MVRMRLEVLEGRLVACTKIVTVPPFGMLAGAVNCVTMPVTPGYVGTGPLIVWLGTNVPHEVSTMPGGSVPAGSELPQVTVQSAPSDSTSWVIVTSKKTAAPRANEVTAGCTAPLASVIVIAPTKGGGVTLQPPTASSAAAHAECNAVHSNLRVAALL